MGLLLRVSALVSLTWAALLAIPPDALTDLPPTPLSRTFGHTLVAYNATLAGLFLWAARAPHRNMPAIVVAIATTAARIVVDLIGLLGDLPPSPAVYFVVDLLVGVALLVGLLEALPRTVAAMRVGDDAPGTEPPPTAAGVAIRKRRH